MFQAFEIFIKGIRSGSEWQVGKKKGTKLRRGAEARRTLHTLLKSLNFILQVMGSMKRFSVGEEHNEIFLEKIFFGGTVEGN